MSSTADPLALVSPFIAEMVDSFEKLEIVVAISRPGAPPSRGELQSVLGFPEDAFTHAIDGLIADGVIKDDHGLAPVEDGMWSEHCRALVALYRSDRMKVVTMMATAALGRLRSRTARAFSDAFVVRSRKGDRDG